MRNGIQYLQRPALLNFVCAHELSTTSHMPAARVTELRPPPCRAPAQLKAERVYWDQASVLQQLGLLPEGLPVAGAEQALKAADPKAVPSNGLIMRGSAPAAR